MLRVVPFLVTVALAGPASEPSRPADDVKRDADRKPFEVLRFCGIEPGMTVADLMAGSGYYTQVLSGTVGSTGKVYGHNSPFVLERYAEKPWSERIATLANVRRVDAPPEKIAFPEQVDAALLIRFYHDFPWQGVDRAAFNASVFEALKPGGIFCVLDHHAEAGSGARDSKTLHRIDAGLVKREILAAGFVWDAESDVLADPDDDRGWSIFENDAARRDKTDRFLYRFRKPEEPPSD